MPKSDMDELLEQSASTDINVFLTAKENAKRAVLDDPSPANLAALERASKLVEGAMQAKASLKDYRAVLAHAGENNRKLGKTKLFEDIKRGRLKRQTDGSFKLKDVDRYMASLPFAGTTDPVAERAADRMRRKEEADIRKAEADAKRAEITVAVQLGKLVQKERVHLELAARAAALAAGIKAAFEARALDMVEKVEGTPKKAQELIELLETILDEAFNEYSREMELEVEFELLEAEAAKEGKNEG